MDLRGEVEIFRQFFLAEVQRFKELLEQDDPGALRGRLPDEELRREMERYIDRLL